MDDHNRFLSTPAAAAYLSDGLKPLSPRTLEKWRVTGDGPPFHRWGSGRGRVFYSRRDLDAWAASRWRRSTSDPGPGGRDGRV